METNILEMIEQFEYYFKKNGLWDIVVYDQTCFRDLLKIIKALNSENQSLRSKNGEFKEKYKYNLKVIELINMLTKPAIQENMNFYR
jgi:hypoxanthine phosphoribosyltransferase